MDQVIGSVCFSNILKGAFCSCMIGYKLGEEYCGKGYMQEALTKLIPIVCSGLSIRRRLHFIKEGYLHSFAQINGVWEDHILYSYINPVLP